MGRFLIKSNSSTFYCVYFFSAWPFLKKKPNMIDNTSMLWGLILEIPLGLLNLVMNTVTKVIQVN